MGHIIVTPLRRIPTPFGDVLHGMKAVDPGFAGFGEVYFSMIAKDCVKGWKCHTAMTLNFVVPHGAVRVMVREPQGELVGAYHLGPDIPDTFIRLTIAPGLWVAFGGLAPGHSLLCNIASLPHDPSEAVNIPLDRHPWNWGDNQP